MATQADAQPRRQASLDTVSSAKQAGKMKVATNKAAIRLHDRWDGKSYRDHAGFGLLVLDIGNMTNSAPKATLQLCTDSVLMQGQLMCPTSRWHTICGWTAWVL